VWERNKLASDARPELLKNPRFTSAESPPHLDLFFAMSACLPVDAVLPVRVGYLELEAGVRLLPLAPDD